MRFSEVKEILEAVVLSGEDFLDEEAYSACGSDFMSDVLAYVKDQSLLLTGMVNPQVIRTADMMDIKCVVFVRGKMPDADMIQLAEERGIVLMSSKERLYNACGKLYHAGLGR
jgi:predicted transcriptional regulator